jgi:hypothetical protein
MVVGDDRCFTFSSPVYENSGDGWTSTYGTDQFLTCRDAFNGRILWRKRNDALARHGEFLTIMGHWLRLGNGKIGPKPEAEAPNRTTFMGIEGLGSWNWTRLGHRKFLHIGYGEFKGDSVSWSDKYVATSSRGSGGSIVDLSETSKKRGFPAQSRDYQGTSLVICNNLLIQGGAISDQEKKQGFIRAIDLNDGKSIWEKMFDAKLAFNGLAVDTCGIIAGFDDGTVACLK